MSSSQVCDHFQLHAWKKDTCANCLKPRKLHVVDSTPQPAKRLSKVTVSRENPQDKDETVSAENESLDAVAPNAEGNTSEPKQPSIEDVSKRQSVVIGSPKPVPLKAKPMVVAGSKPEKARKPTASVLETEGKSVSTKGTNETSVSDPRPSNSSPQTTLNSKPQAAQSSAEVGNEPANTESSKGSSQSQQSSSAACQKSGKTRRPQVTPPKVPNVNPPKVPETTKPSGGTSLVQDNQESIAKLDVRNRQNSNSHYYQIYDISAKGLSGAPEPVDASELAETGKSGEPRALRMSVLDDDQHNLAMPYNVVDVTACPLTRDQMVGKAPPQLPLTPAPKSDMSFGMNNTLPSNKPRSTRDNVKQSVLLMHDILRTKLGESVSDLRSNEMKIAASGTPDVRQGLNTTEETTTDLYEEFGNSSVTVPSHKSLSAFEAKLAAMSKLDLSKAASPATSMISAKPEDAKPEIQNGTENQEPIETSDIKSVDGTAAGRQEKGRKGGGKSFFQKFLKRGNKDAAPEQASNRTSCGSITIEPVLNIPLVSQNGVESVEKNTVFGESSGDLSASANSPRVISLKEKPTLFPVGSPSRKPTSEAQGICETLGDAGKSGSTVDTNKKDLDAGEGQRVLSVKPSALKSPLPQSVNTRPTEGTLSETSSLGSTGVEGEKARLSDGSEGKMHITDGGTDPLVLQSGDVDPLAKDPVDLSPVDPVDHAFNTLSKGRSAKDIKPSKAPRKMVAPPPMAPPPPPPTTPPSSSLPVSKETESLGSTMSPKHLRNSAVDSDHPQRCISPSSQGTLGHTKQVKLVDSSAWKTAGVMSHTLPRASSSMSSSASASSGEEKVVLPSVGLRQLDLAAKQARNKTVSEGMRFDKMLISTDGGEEKNSTDESSAASQLERRASKFLNRALPAPPPAEAIVTNNQAECLDEIDNLYELVSQSDQKSTKTADDDPQLTYEDIDVYCRQRNDGGGSKTSSTSSSQRSTSVVATATGATLVPDSSVAGSGYYLEPVSGKEDPETRSRTLSKDTWRPCPAPRASHLSKGLPGQETPTSMSYVNTRMINGVLPLTVNDGFDSMAGLVIDMLHHLADRLYSSYVTRFLKNRSDVIWTDFELLDCVPEFVQETALYYRAKHLVLAPCGCVLMVMKDDLVSRLSLEPTHANVISPLLCFPVSSGDLESLGKSSGETTFTTGNRTVAVLLFSSVATVDGFWEKENTKAANSSGGVVQLEQFICHCVIEVLNALLYLRESGCSVLRLLPDDVIMTCFSDARWHSLVKPSVMTFDVCSDHDSALLSDDIIQLVVRMLRTESCKSEAKIQPRTRYSRGLQRVVRILQQKTWDSLETGRNLLEFLLWGPSEDEAKIVAMTDKRETAFRVWLEVARCRMTSELVLEAERHNLELANQARFLSRVTESSLLGVTKLLFE